MLDKNQTKNAQAQSSLDEAQRLHDGLRAFLEDEELLRQQYGEGHLYVRPKFYEVEQSLITVGGWAFLDGEPAIVPIGLDMLTVVCGTPDNLKTWPRDPQFVFDLLRDFATLHETPCPHYEITVPEDVKASMLATIEKSPDHNPEPRPKTTPQLRPRQLGNDPQSLSIKRSLNELQSKTGAIFPILKSYDWRARNVAAFDYFQEINHPTMPLIAFGRDTEENYIFITKKDLESQPISDIRREAFHNLEQHSVGWELFNENILYGIGTSFVAEKILCRSFLLDAEKKLNTQMLLIGIPRRNCVYAVNSDASKDVLNKFRQLCDFTFQDDSSGNAPITNLLFQFENAKLIGVEPI